MIPTITHPAGELLVRKLHEGTANLAVVAAQLDGLARALLNETDSQTGLDGFTTAFGDQAPAALGCVTGFRHLYASLAGHDVPPLQGQPELQLPQPQPTLIPTSTSPSVVDGAASAVPSAPAADPPAQPVSANPPSEAEAAPAEPSEGEASDPGDAGKSKTRRK